MTKTYKELVDEAHSIMTRAERTGSFNRETEARVSQLLRMAELLRADQHGPAYIAQPKTTAELFAQSRIRNMDSATLEFFGSKRRSANNENRTISITGGRIDEIPSGYRAHGKAIGACSELRDYSFALESRTYAGLSEGVTADGGGTLPLGYIPHIFAAFKRTDQILEAANWIPTADGRATNIPSLNDTSTSAVTVAELGAMSFANPTFSQVTNASAAFPYATTWTSQTIKASYQLWQDAVPLLADTLADAFRVRFARGFGASVVTTVLGDAPVGATSATPTAIVQKDLLELVKSVDAEYAAAETSGWSMNWNTLVYIFENVVTSATSGDALFHAKKDDRGHYLLMGKPVFISNSLDDIGATKKPVLFGDFNQLLVRHVPAEAVIRRYDELYMANMQKGFEMLFRADALIMHAGGSGDDPIKVLQCHAG
jgi:HK97 family phage major capsid protein